MESLPVGKEEALASLEADGRLDGVTIRAGVENLADESPPIFPFWPNANTDPSQFDVLGRRYFVTMALQF